MREATTYRKTNETEVRAWVKIDGSGKSSIKVPIGFLKHMIEAFSKHSLIDIDIEAQGDLEVDQHHTVEDIALVLGETLRKALGDKRGIERAGFFLYPMDDALAQVAVDLSGRPYLQFDVEFRRRFCGDFDSDLTEHFFEALANSLGANIAIRLLSGKNDHHKLEAIFKAFAKAMKQACQKDKRIGEEIPSTKGVIS
ncbi:MAG: imidazoleglycerol-phosphate dehydratase HisB [Methanobacteriota archaeon]|nr:MAG: imidazoleglycerol-phosphate dehydratase HisB [Euryarchaeota archaeon]